ncbi:unnamed protein product [Triticum turgidum subsp. durum]|uniref:Uncharacterized protein n=1 Tax=Triticum turgidum subsp. durum TaxID=4567 RepID=A0A9R0Q1M7_TRITD|nr:unnamed protein product [Triticum turgidum subsp. durum]
MPKDMSLHPAVVCFIAWNHETKMESPTSWGSSSPSSFGRRHSLMTPALSILPEPAFAPLRDLSEPPVQSHCPSPSFACRRPPSPSCSNSRVRVHACSYCAALLATLLLLWPAPAAAAQSSRRPCPSHPRACSAAADALLLLRPRCSPLMAQRAASCSPTAVPATVGQPHRTH